MIRINSNKIAVSLEEVGQFPKGVLTANPFGDNISIFSSFGNADIAYNYAYDFFRDSDGNLLGTNQEEVIIALNKIFKFTDTDGLIDEITRSSQEGNSIATTLTTFIDVLSASKPLDTGFYRVLVEYMWAGNSTNDDIITKLFIDGNEPYSSVLPYMHRQEPKDSGGNLLGLSGSFSDQVYNFSFNYQFEITEEKSVDFLLQLATSRDNRAVAVYFPKIFIYRTKEI